MFDEPNDEASLYINGSLVSTQAHPGTWWGPTGNFEVGANGVANNPFDGKEAHVAVFAAKSKLTAQNFADLWARLGCDSGEGLARAEFCAPPRGRDTPVDDGAGQARNVRVRR